MKLTWRDMINALLALSGGAIVYAKFYDYSWAVIGSWRSSVAVMAGIGVLMFAFSRFNFANRSILNEGEMAFGLVAIGLAVAGMFYASELIFYVLAALLGTLWLVDTGRHARHSMVDSEKSSHHHVPAH